jgi:hypothetical protein
MLDWGIEVGTTVNRRRDIHGGEGYEPRLGGAWYGGIEPSGKTPNVHTGLPTSWHIFVRGLRHVRCRPET